MGVLSAQPYLDWGEVNRGNKVVGKEERNNTKREMVI